MNPLFELKVLYGPEWSGQESGNDVVYARTISKSDSGGIANKKTPTPTRQGAKRGGVGDPRGSVVYPLSGVPRTSPMPDALKTVSDDWLGARL